MNHIVFPLTSPQTANYLQIEFNTSSKNLNITNFYFGSPTFKRSIESGLWSDENIWQPKRSSCYGGFCLYFSKKIR